MSWTWQGRQLATAAKNGTSLSFTYDSDGIRTSKTVGGVKTSYLLNGTQILAQTTNGKTLCFFYDQQGNRVAMADSSNHIYYYLYNLQGDVIALADGQTGKLAATYTYDAWGKCTVTNAAGSTIGTDNPFRYRGYYYDTETSLYYLQSRYYDPDTGRFVNADTFISTDVSGVLSTNMFAYCENNPISNVDSYGFGSFLCTELGGNPHTEKYFKKQKSHAKYEELASISASGGLGLYLSVEESIVKDDEGALYSVTTFKAGGGVGVSAKAPEVKDLISFDGLSKLKTDDIYQLQGVSHSMGATVGLVSVEWDGSIDPVNIDASVALGVGLEFHATINYTVVKKIPFIHL